MTTDNRTNVQIVADALRSMPEAERDDDRDPAVVVAEYAVAALVAAQGAAPQAESEELAWYKRAAKHSADSMAEARATLQQLADRVDPFVFDELSSVLDDQPLDYETGWAIGEVAPVLPSSTAQQAEVEYVYCPIHGDLLAARRSFVCEHAKKGHEYGAPVLPSSGVDEVRAEAVREVARYINRIAPNGLVPKKMILADMEFAADRLGRGIHANGNDRAVQGGESRGE